MGRAVVFVATAVVIVLVGASALPLERNLVATRKLVDLTAQRLKTTRPNYLHGSSPSSDLTCDACKIIVDTLDKLFLENKTEDEIVDVITDICIDLKIEDRNVCTLVVKEFRVSFSSRCSVRWPSLYSYLS